MIGQSTSPTAGSFIRPSRKADKPQSFLQALEQKYAPPSDADDSIQISGKVVEEVGFEKIQRHLQNFQELRTVILDKRCISIEVPDYGLQHLCDDVQDLQLKVRELDLSRNLLETWSGVLSLCTVLPHLRMLSVAYVSFN